MGIRVLLSCEHYTNAIPHYLQEHVHIPKPILDSHQGIDIGANQLFALLQPIGDYSITAPYSRLLIDFNRSLGNPTRLSPYSSMIPKALWNDIEKDYFHYWRTVENVIRNWVKQNHRVIHLSIHTFTPALNNEVRDADIGLLFDPARSGEKQLCEKWQKILSKTPFTTKLNYPYQGIGDGLTTSMRTVFTDEAYIGIELEVNQKFFQTK